MYHTLFSGGTAVHHWPGAAWCGLVDACAIAPSSCAVSLRACVVRHTEDNYVYSTSYLHAGAHKTSYGIPAHRTADFL